MRFYDCDEAEQFEALSERVDIDGLFGAKLLQSFGPDSPAEARNRGFRPVS